MARVLIGTSGWSYPGWRGTFYPKDLPGSRYLAFYAGEFSTCEVNYSFYHLPKPGTYAKWAVQVPGGFLFAVKASRLITHTKRLRDVEEAWRAFIGNAEALAAHFGPVLLQFPESFRCDITRLEAFLEMARPGASDCRRLLLACEFRHESWFVDPVYRLLRRHGAALCIADSPRHPRRDVLTADFTYLRFHGRTKLFASSYSDAELAEEAGKLTAYIGDGMDAFVYFNNDARGHAVRNARTLRSLLEW
jgi:uncharacterized protein YecE (DUF72 family)